MFIGFETYFKQILQRNTDSAKSDAIVGLPFCVERHVSDKFNLEWTDSNARCSVLDVQRSREKLKC